MTRHASPAECTLVAEMQADGEGPTLLEHAIGNILLAASEPNASDSIQCTFDMLGELVKFCRSNLWRVSQLLQKMDPGFKTFTGAAKALSLPLWGRADRPLSPHTHTHPLQRSSAPAPQTRTCLCGASRSQWSRFGARMRAREINTRPASLRRRKGRGRSSQSIRSPWKSASWCSGRRASRACGTAATPRGRGHTHGGKRWGADPRPRAACPSSPTSWPARTRTMCTRATCVA